MSEPEDIQELSRFVRQSRERESELLRSSGLMCPRCKHDKRHHSEDIGCTAIGPYGMCKCPLTPDDLP